MNEPGNHGNIRAVSVRAALDAKAFRKWRKAHQFASPELAQQAELVEHDLGLLPQLGPHNTETRALVMNNLASFAAAMASA